MVAMGGFLAEAKLTGDGNLLGAVGDLLGVQAYLDWLSAAADCREGGERENEDETLARLFQRAKKIVHDNWVAVERVAHRLLEEGQLSGRRARSAYQATVRPIA